MSWVGGKLPRRENVRENMSKGKMSDSEGECLTLAVYASFDADCDAIHRNCRRLERRYRWTRDSVDWLLYLAETH